MNALFTEARVALFAKAIAVAFLLAFVATVASMRDMMLSPGRGFGGDFVAFYAAGALAREGRPQAAYDMAAIAEAEKRALPQATYALMYAYPPVFQMVLKPLAGLPYVWAYVVWAALLFALHVAVWRVAFGNSPAFWAALGCSAVYLNVLHGQNGLLSAALLGIGLLALRHRPLLAGIAIGALCYKPQLGISVGLLLLAGGQWRAVGGAALSVAVLCAASAVVLGPDIWRAFIELGGGARVVLEADGGPLDKIASVYSLVRKLKAPVIVAYALHGVVALAVMALAIRAWRRGGEELPRVAMAAATVPLFSPYFFDYDLAVIVLPIGALLIDGFRNGWMPGMRTILLIAWFAPAIAPKLAEHTGLQIMPLAGIALFWAAWRRCESRIEASGQTRWT
jgi:hypothetical protein